jgi:hypothetical protein
MRFAMNKDFHKQRARQVRYIAAKADPVIKQRLLDLADLYDGKRKTSVTPLPPAPATTRNPSGERGGHSGQARSDRSLPFRFTAKRSATA